MILDLMRSSFWRQNEQKERERVHGSTLLFMKYLMIWSLIKSKYG